MNTTTCIYHGNCADGFGAAWVVRKALGEIDFNPGKHQEAPPDVTGKDVVMVDFSYKRSVLLEMAEKAKSILIIDHHKTAMEELVDLPANVTAKFSMEHSGAMLAWHYFFPEQEPPRLLLHIEDRDLWRFALPGTREIQACLFSFPYEFSVWDALMSTSPDALIAEGMAIERKHFKDIRELLGETTREMVIGGHIVPVANLPYTLSSDAGHELAKGRPFAACYWDTPGGRVFSLRSTAEGEDVGAVAQQYGGGGHRNASGFRVSFAQAQEFELVSCIPVANSPTERAAAVPVVQTSPLHSQTVRDLLVCCRAWEPDVRILGNVRAADAAAALERLSKIETAAKLACGLLWMTAEWRQEKTDAAYQALLEAVGGSGSQRLRESIEAAFSAGHKVDAPPGCYWR